MWFIQVKSGARWFTKVGARMSGLQIFIEWVGQGTNMPYRMLASCCCLVKMCHTVSQCDVLCWVFCFGRAPGSFVALHLCAAWEAAGSPQNDRQSRRCSRSPTPFKGTTAVMDPQCGHWSVADCLVRQFHALGCGYARIIPGLEAWHWQLVQLHH